MVFFECFFVALWSFLVCRLFLTSCSPWEKSPLRIACRIWIIGNPPSPHGCQSPPGWWGVFFRDRKGTLKNLKNEKKPLICLRWNPGWRISQVWYFFNGEGIEKFSVQQKMDGWKCSMGQQSRIICLIEPCFITSWCHAHYYRIRIIINSKGTSSLQPCKTPAKTIPKRPTHSNFICQVQLEAPKNSDLFHSYSFGTSLISKKKTLQSS